MRIHRRCARAHGARRRWRRPATRQCVQTATTPSCSAARRFGTPVCARADVCRAWGLGLRLSALAVYLTLCHNPLAAILLALGLHLCLFGVQTMT